MDSHTVVLNRVDHLLYDVAPANEKGLGSGQFAS